MSTAGGYLREYDRGVCTTAKALDLHVVDQAARIDRGREVLL